MHLPRFYSDDSELNRILFNIKQYSCPHCHRCGTFNLHGYLYGYLDISASLCARGRRIFCSSRRKRNPGCGRTISLFPAYVLTGLTLTALALWKLLCAITQNNRVWKNCQLCTTSSLSLRSLYQTYVKFQQAQPSIRATLMRVKPPPDIPHTSSPLSATINHLRLAFPTAQNPLVAFQKTFQKALL